MFRTKFFKEIAVFVDFPKIVNFHEITLIFVYLVTIMSKYSNKSPLLMISRIFRGKRGLKKVGAIGVEMMTLVPLFPVGYGPLILALCQKPSPIQHL